MRIKRTEQVAKNGYEVCRAFEVSNGVINNTDWNKLDSTRKESLVRAVSMLKKNRRAQASSVHNFWIDNMIDKGWSYGKVYDAEAKTHPDMIDYRSLPPLHRAKDKLFLQTVRIGYLEPIN